MKTSAKAKPETKQATDAPVKVPAALQAAIAGLAEIKSGISTLAGKQEKKLIETAELVASLFETREDAAPVLKAAYEKAKLTTLVDGQQRSRILTQAFPVDPAALELARTAPITFLDAKGEKVTKAANTLQLNAIAAGSLVPNKKGDLWIKKPKSRGPGSNPHNVTTPAETAKKAIENAATAFIANSKGGAIAFFNIVIEVLDEVKEWHFNHEEAQALLAE